MYDLQLDRLAALEPDLVVTRATCDVCAVDASQVQTAVTQIEPEPDILALDPYSLSDVVQDIERIGQAVECPGAAEELTAELTATVETVERRGDTAITSVRRPRTAALNRTDPPIRAGHPVTDMIDLAGGDATFQPNGTSEPVAWNVRKQYDPEVLVATPWISACAGRRSRR